MFTMMSTTDPFSRGPSPVGVRTFAVRDRERAGRELLCELWYPTEATLAGRDLAPPTRDQYQLLPVLPTSWQAAVRDAPLPAASERRPLVLFSHGLGGHRRQSTFVCTHLASHGFLVVAPDHSGNTVVDLIASFMGFSPRPAGTLNQALPAWMAERPRDAEVVLDALLGGVVPGLRTAIDPGALGVFGHSFGGWTTLNLVATDARVRAAVALAPAGGAGRADDPLPGGLRLDWTWRVPILVVAAAQDSILPIAGISALVARIPPPCQFIVLSDADHMHFLDEVERAHEMIRNLPGGIMLMPRAVGIRPFAQLMPAKPAQAAVRALTLSHFQAHLLGDEGARAWLAGDCRAELAARGVQISCPA
jgi:predicted dienelactone hydrolase